MDMGGRPSSETDKDASDPAVTGFGSTEITNGDT
jgi:hypothetical protein